MVYKRTRLLDDGTVRTYPDWWYRFMRNGKLVVVNTKQNNKQTAKELEAAHRTRLAKGEGDLWDGSAVPAFKDFAKAFLESVESRSPKKAKDYKSKLKSILDFPPIANARLDAFDDGSLIDRYVRARIKDVTPATINRSVATLRHFLRQAVERKVVRVAPKIKMLEGERQRESVLTKEREPIYLAATEEPLTSVAILILETGLRVGEALALTWDDIILAPGTGKKLGYLHVRAGKTKNARRTVSLTARASKLLEERKARHGGADPAGVVDPYVFSNGYGKPYTNVHLARLQKVVRDKLMLPQKDGGQGWTDAADLVIHSLRHTMLTRLGAEGADAFTIMRIAGHGSVLVSQRYVHPSDESMERAIERMQGRT
jgi:integrase